MDVDSLLCLNDKEEKSFELLKMENKKNLNEIFNNLEESVDCAIQNTGEDTNISKTSNSVDTINSSDTNFEHSINIVSSTIKHLDGISESKKINRFHQNEYEELIVLADKDQGSFENITEKPCNLPSNNEIVNRYPELFEIFSGNSLSQFSNYSLNSKSETCSENNISRQLIDKKSKEFIGNSFSKFPENHFDEEVRSIKEILSKGVKKKEKNTLKFHDHDNIVPEKLSSLTFRSDTKKMDDSLVKLKKRERPILLFNTQSKSSLSNITNKNTNKQEIKIPIKRKKSNDLIQENHSCSKIKKISDENVTPIVSSVNQQNDDSNSSLISSAISHDIPKYNNENNFSGFNFFSRSMTLEGDQEKCKLQNQVKKTKQQILGNLEKTAQGDIKVKLNDKRKVFVGRNEKITQDKMKISDEKYEENRKKIFLDVIDILIGVKTTLFENRKLVESIQGHFQNCSIFHTIISDNAVTLLNEGISRCTMRIQSNEKSKDLFVGANDLLIKSVRNLMKVVKEEKEYLKQQEYYYCKHFPGVTKNNRNSSKRNTKHTLIGNDTLLSSSQKDRIEQLITYSVSLIKQIVPKNLSEKADNPKTLSKKSPKRKVKIEKGGKTQMEITLKAKDGLISENEDNNSKNLKNETKSKSTTKKISSLENSNLVVSSLKLTNKNSNNEKLTKSSTIVLPGNCSNSKQFSNTVIRGTNKGQNYCNTQPIWKPAGNVSFPVRPISRQNTRLITSSFDKKGEEKSDDISIRIPTSSRNNDPKKSSLPHKMQRSSTSMGAYDLRKKSDMNVVNFEQKPMSARIEKHKCNLMTKNLTESTENLPNKNSGRAKWKTRHPEVIQMLKDLIKNSSEEENKISPNCSNLPNNNNDSMNSKKSKKIDTSVSNTKLENSQSKLSIKNKVNSKSGISINRNNIEDKTIIRDNSSKTKLDHRKYLRKNSSDSSYLETYIKLNSRQNHASNSRKSLIEKKTKISPEERVEDKEEKKNDNNEMEISSKNSKSALNFQDRNISQSVCELGTKVSSSKSCQVSFKPSTCSRSSDIIFDTESISFESENQCSETFMEKSKQFVSKSKKSFHDLKEILEKYGLNVDLVDEAERKSNLMENESFTSLLLDKEKGAIVAVCSSQTLFDKLASLSDNDLEIVEIKNMNNFSLESFDNDNQVSKIERNNKTNYEENSEIFPITDKMENNSKNSLLKQEKNKSEEYSSIDCTELCQKSKEKMERILDFGKNSEVQEKFSFVNLILKAETERSREPVNFSNNEKKDNKDMSKFEDKYSENGRKKEEEFISIDLANKMEKSENKMKILCDEQKNTCVNLSVIERNEISILNEDKKEKESLSANSNSNNKNEFLVNLASNEETEFSPVNLNLTKETNEENKPENLKQDFENTFQIELSSLNLIEDKEMVKFPKINEVNCSTKSEKILKFEDIKNSVSCNEEKNKNEEEKQFSSANLSLLEKIVKELESFEEKNKNLKSELSSLNFDADKENIEIQEKYNETNSFGISKKISKIEDLETSTLNEKIVSNEFSSVNLTSIEKEENKPVKELLNFQEDFKEKIEDSNQELSSLNYVADKQSTEFVNKINFQISSEKVEEIENSDNLTPVEEVENKEEFVSVNLIPPEKPVQELLNNQEDFLEKTEDSQKELPLYSLINPISNKEVENKKEFSSVDSLNEKIVNVASLNLTSIVETEKNFSIFEENSKKKIKNSKKLLPSSKIVTNENSELHGINEANNSIKKIPQNEKSGKNLEFKKNISKRSESNSKLKKKLSPIKTDDERFKKRLNSVLKAIATKSESLLQETKLKNEHHKITSKSSLENSNSFSKLNIPPVAISKTEIVANSSNNISPEIKYSSKIEIIENNQELNEKFNSPMKLISKLNFIPSLSAIWNNKKESQIKYEMKKKNFENSKNSSENLFSTGKRRNNQKCKTCGKRRKYSSNLNYPLEMEIFESSELLKTRQQNTIFLDDYSLPIVIKCKDSKIHKFTLNDTQNRLAQNLAITTLKLAKKRAQNLYKNVVICRQCLTSNVNNLEKNCPIDKNCLELKNVIVESKHDFSAINYSSGNAKIFRKALKTFRNSSNQREKYQEGNKKISKILLDEHFSKLFPIFIVMCLLILWYFY